VSWSRGPLTPLMPFGWSRRRGAHGGATPARMRRELAQALDVLTADAPLVLVLEDLQWSDRSTVDLLAHLTQRGRRGLAHGWPAAPPPPWRRRPQKLGGWRCPAARGGAALVVSAPVRRCVGAGRTAQVSPCGGRAAGRCGWEEGTRAGLCQARALRRATPAPVAVLEELLADREASSPTGGGEQFV
jgi:AAA ATPase-like protein